MRFTEIIDEDYLRRIESVPSVMAPVQLEEEKVEMFESSVISSLPEFDLIPNNPVWQNWH